MRQVRTAAIDQVDAGQMILLGDFLGAQVFLDRHRIVGTALDGRVIADNHHVLARHAADTGDHSCAMDIALIHAVGCQRADLQEGRACIQQTLDPVTGQKLAAGQVFLPRPFGSACRCLGRFLLQIRDQAVHGLCVFTETGGLRIERGGQLGHEMS